jgi:hypothetical protein
MTQKLSFSALEREFRAVFRDKIDKSEDAQDVEKLFTHVVGQLVRQALSDQVDVLDTDIVYDAEAPFRYAVSGKLADDARFRDVYDNSDLPAILKRFADTAHKTIGHYQKVNVQNASKLRSAPAPRHSTGDPRTTGVGSPRRR